MRRERERKGVFTRRALLIAGAELTAFGALAAKLYQVQVAEGAKYRTLAESNRISVRLLPRRAGACSIASACRSPPTTRTGARC